MSIKTFTSILSDITPLKATDCNVFAITTIMCIRFLTGKAMTWQAMFKAHNESCHPSLVVSMYSDGRDGLNARNELFLAEHDADHPLFGLVVVNKNPNKKVHSSDKKRRGFLTGVTAKQGSITPAHRRAVARFYKK